MISATFLFGCEDIDRVGVGHKMVDTFEKMDAINPTFDRPHDGYWGRRAKNEDKIHVFFNFNHLFGVGPFV